MAADWNELEDELAKLDDYVAAALFLLQQTVEGYERLSVNVLQRKMTLPIITESSFRCLHIYSYADYAANPDNLLNPQATAFFFLRQVHRPRNSTQEAVAFCLTVGARPDGEGGLSQADLTTQLEAVCIKMCDDHIPPGPGAPELEVMHTRPNARFKHFGRTLAAAYRDFVGATAPPMLKPRPDPGGTIDVIDPWTHQSGTEILRRFTVVLPPH